MARRLQWRSGMDNATNTFDPNELMAQVRRIAGAMARRLPAHVDIDELVSLGNLGLVEAQRRFDPSRGVPFAAFAIARIRGAMLDGMRDNDPLTREERARVKKHDAAPAVALVNLNAARESSAPNVAADDDLHQRRERARARLALGKLAERERRVVERHVLDEEPLRRIGETLGVTESRVCQIVSSALARIRAIMDEDAAPMTEAA